MFRSMIDMASRPRGFAIEKERRCSNTNSVGLVSQTRCTWIMHGSGPVIELHIRNSALAIKVLSGGVSGPFYSLIRKRPSQPCCGCSSLGPSWEKRRKEELGFSNSIGYWIDRIKPAVDLAEVSAPLDRQRGWTVEDGWLDTLDK